MKGIFRLAFGIILATLAFPAAAQAVYADFTVSPESPFSLDTVTFTSTSGGGVTSLFWDLDNDGAYDDGTTETVTRTFPAAGPNTVRLFVWGQPGESGQKQRVVQVNNRPPDASLAYFQPTPEAGEPVSFVSTSSDPDGTLASLLWDLNGDGVFGDATGRHGLVHLPQSRRFDGRAAGRGQRRSRGGRHTAGAHRGEAAPVPQPVSARAALGQADGRGCGSRGSWCRRRPARTWRCAVRVTAAGAHRETRLAKPRAGAKPGSFNLCASAGSSARCGPTR